MTAHDQSYETYVEYMKVTRLSDGSEIRKDVRREVERWLARAVIEAKAIGWDECLMAIEQDAWIDWATNERPRNPYRADETEEGL